MFAEKEKYYMCILTFYVILTILQAAECKNQTPSQLLVNQI